MKNIEYIEFKFTLEKLPAWGGMYFGLIDAIKASEDSKNMHKESNSEGDIDFFCPTKRRIDFALHKSRKFIHI